ncbi:hypothetical protein [Paenibacillus glycinis]|uniref:Restriction endonuclease n=1 Tax=Paenibacillus glycinis TaxID=2697035 RepID=A0ABW9XTE4_9BACL|nr:hypothetical protein [Paenibacillus glycinis]NBD25616.1 hypothetical protein [Paenibacillus glycinis]
MRAVKELKSKVNGLEVIALVNQTGNIIYLVEDLVEEKLLANLNPVNNPNSKYLKAEFNPNEESFVDFIVKNFNNTIGKNSKNKLLARWLKKYYDWRTQDHETDEYNFLDEHTSVLNKISTGNIRALLQLAFDVYCLQIENSFPKRLRKRLQNIDHFQGVKYEISVASLMLRAGFDIDYDVVETNNYGKSCEFIATHRETKDRIGIEAKSKKFKGVLDSSSGEMKDHFLSRLLSDAKKQAPNHLPFIIFLDSNLKPGKNLHLGEIPYFNDLSSLIEGDHNRYINDYKKTPYNYIIVTNYSDHYLGNELAPDKTSFCVLGSTNPNYYFNDDQRIKSDLICSLQNYTKGINLVTRKVLRY